MVSGVKAIYLAPKSLKQGVEALRKDIQRISYFLLHTVNQVKFCDVSNFLSNMNAVIRF